MSQLTRLLEKELVGAELAELAGAAGLGARGTDELVYGALLAVSRGTTALPERVQKAVDRSAIAVRELERAVSALAVLDEDAGWSEMRHALDQLPPAHLLHILYEEMSADQMKTLAGLSLIHI